MLIGAVYTPLPQYPALHAFLQKRVTEEVYAVVLTYSSEKSNLPARLYAVQKFLHTKLTIAY